MIDLKHQSISYSRSWKPPIKGRGWLTLLLLALTPPLLPAIQVCSDFAAFEHASFARKSPVVAKHANRDDRAGRQGGGTVSDNQLLLLRHFLLPRSFLLFSPLRAMLWSCILDLPLLGFTLNLTMIASAVDSTMDWMAEKVGIYLIKSDRYRS